MHNVWLIARREYIERIRTRGFLITTVLIPIIMGGFIFGSSFLGGKVSSESHIAIVSSDNDTDTNLALDLQTELERRQPSAQSTSASRQHITVDAMNIAPDTRAILDQQLDSGDLDGYLWIAPAATPDSRPTFTFTPRSFDQQSLRNTIASALNTVLMRQRLAHHGVAGPDLDAMMQPVEIATARAPHRVDREAAEISVTVLFFLMYMVIMLYGMNVARSIIEEKTSRIFEVLLATIRPEEMMAGKIIGVGSVGLTQVGLWIAAGWLLASGSLAPLIGGQPLHFALTASQIVYFFVYFLLGYLFYSSIAAALGAMTNSEQELQQLNMFLVLPLAFCFVALKAVLTSPDGPLARSLALIPPFTPLLMYVRVTLGHPAPWEVALSLALTSASIYAIVWVTSRIYRVGVLMYGKRPSLPELLRWLKYS
jgi:ABC-2 type transport system permease protein